MKKILLIFVILFFGCTKMEIEPLPQPVQKIFSVTESSVSNEQSIHFDLPSHGVYYLTLIDKESGNVVSREKFIGQSGENIKKIYTNSLQNRYLYLLLEDVTNKELNRTTIILK